MIVIPPTIATLVRYGFGRALAVFIGLSLVDNAVGLILMPRLIGRRLDIAPLERTERSGRLGQRLSDDS